MTKYVNDNGVSEMWTNTKNYISAQLLGKSDVGHTHSASDITSGLATVATSGSYNDLSNKPIIPSKTSDLTNDSNFISSAIKEGSISSYGWCLLHGDLLIQWGTVVFNNGQGTLNFSKPFYETPFVVMNYGDTYAYDSPCAVIINSTTNTYFTARKYNSVSAWRCNWIAIGKKGY